MKLNERKLHFIEDYLKISDEKVVAELETVLQKSKNKKKDKSTFKKFSGIVSNKEARELTKIISEGCETIDANDWR